MTTRDFYTLEHLSVIDVTGEDAATIVHNLTTNQVKGLGVGEGRETFVTDVRGKMLGHLTLYRLPDRLRLIGPVGQSETVAEHIDRYTIREDATPLVRDDEYFAALLDSSGTPLLDSSGRQGLQSELPTVATTGWTTSQMGNLEVAAYATGWLGAGTTVLLVPIARRSDLIEALASQSGMNQEIDDFHRARILAGFPWYGVDLDASNLPQEADRDEFAISFTKGCYLGQETVARLDALGQVQRKLVRWSLTGSIPQPGVTLTDNEKTVGRLTSVAPTGAQEAVAIGFARRSHFDAGATAEGIDPGSGQAFRGTVL